MRKNGAIFAYFSLPDLVLRIAEQSSHRCTLPTREVLSAKSPRDTHRCPRDARRGQTSRRCRPRASTTGDAHVYAIVASTFASYQYPARFATLRGASTSKAGLALLERTLQGHALAEQHAAARPGAGSSTGAGARKTRGVQATHGAPLADADSRREAARLAEDARFGAYSLHAVAYA